MKHYTLLLVLFLFVNNYSYSQVKISKTGGIPNANAILDVESGTKGVLIPRVDLDDVTTAAPLSGVITDGMIIYNYGGDEPDGMYMWEGASWTKINNQSGGPPSPAHYIGQLFGGGIVVYVDVSGNHGLIASLHDLDYSGNFRRRYSNNYSPAGASSFYDGASNTAAMVALDATPGYAGTMCNSYSYGGYSDWYLPAQSQAFQIKKVARIINNVLLNDGDPSTYGLDLSTDYWTSTDTSPYSSAYTLSSNAFFTNMYTKFIFRRVRAFRSF